MAWYTAYIIGFEGGFVDMLPTLEEAKKELLIAGEMNPGPWVARWNIT